MTDQPFHDDEARTLLQQDGVRGLGVLFTRHRDWLRGVVKLRLDSRLQGRIDPSDVIQEAFMEAQERLEDYLQDPKMEPFLWVRFLTVQRLLILHRHHLGTKQRDARREITLDAPCYLEASSAHLASCLVDSQATPGQTVQNAEAQLRLQQALEHMDLLDREVLALRHFEQLDNRQTAQVLGISPGAASQRYYRALKKLKEILAGLIGESG